MAIKSLEQRKRQQILLIIGLGILITAIVILYFAFWRGGLSIQPFREGGQPVLEQETRTSLILEEKLKKINLDFNFLTEKILPLLKSYGDLPVEKGVTGRTNPFVSY